MAKALFIDAKRMGYCPQQCGKTLTVGELIAILEDFEEDRPVYLSHDEGYTYGSISRYDISAQEELEDDDEMEDDEE